MANDGASPIVTICSLALPIYLCYGKLSIDNTLDIILRLVLVSQHILNDLFAGVRRFGRRAEYDISVTP